MSIYDRIAESGRNAGAGLNAYVQGRYNVEQDRLAREDRQNQFDLERSDRQSQIQRNAYVQDRDYNRQLQADADKHWQGTIELLKYAKPGQEDKILKMRRNQAIEMNLPGAAQSPENFADYGFDFSQFKQGGADAEFEDFKRREQFKVDLAASAPMSPRDVAQQRSAEANAAAAELKIEDARAKTDSAKATKAEVSALASDILADGGYQSVYGGIQGLLPSTRQNVIDAEANIDRLVDLLTLENTSKMTGVLSESDIKILQRAGTKLANKRISDAAAKAELERIAGIFQKIEASGTLVRDESGKVVGSQPAETNEVDDLVRKYGNPG